MYFLFMYFSLFLQRYNSLITKYILFKYTVECFSYIHQVGQPSLLSNSTFSWHLFQGSCAPIQLESPIHTHQAILGYQRGVREFSSILTLSTWRQHQIPQLKGSVLQDYVVLPSDARHKPWLLSLLPTDWLPIGASRDPLLRLDWFAGVALRIQGNMFTSLLKDRSQ